MKYILVILFTLLVSTATANTKRVTTKIHAVNKQGIGQQLGDIVVSESPYGLVFSISSDGVSPGMHGFHLHQYASCEAKRKKGNIIPGLAAGGHYDPLKSNKHGMPWGDGHLGDLPPVYADKSGSIRQFVLAPRLKVIDLPGRALMLHEGGDNHSDSPTPLGGGGARITCGTIH
ncbi:superoxide dismutase [Cu-Zn] SodC2 [Pseudoalteromonas sp. NBT06-2]|uniref:superoxide dismutase family protein n=1 Tax=Pseudoalteromonas sp. NBT06-2 TaxID=2025950 RepID=UPI000BA6DEBD|nr:superoxide dismutase family protein [Pseudoalteromonas sp. NBT06-2]PAJ74568.1 superoxide dismutase [Cu-Zn] SodC2 [Pseudoalteromonas sp. NBT06-2]